MSGQLNDILEQVGEIAVPGHQLLDEARTFIRRFCVFPDEHCLTAVTLWTAHAHMVEHFHTTPRLALLSPDPASGKTRVLEVLDLLAPQTLLSLSASPAAIFRSLAQEQITLLFDEVDAIWNRRGKDDNHEDLRALLNAGYKRGATIPRCEGARHEVTRFEVYCAVALAGLGELPDTIMSRSIIVRMRRRANSEPIEPFRFRRHGPDGHAMRERLATWAADVGEDAGNDWPKMPHGIVDRNEEIWEPLIAVADQAGGHWPGSARKACVALCKAAEDRSVSLGIRLLGDIKTLFGDKNSMSTQDILDSLINGESGLDDDAPWGDMYGKAIDARKLARLLKPYGIKSEKVKTDGKALQGYRRESFWDAWQRYTPAQAELVEPMEPDGLEALRGNGAEVPAKVPDNGYSAEPVEPSTTETAQPRDEVPEVPEVPDFRGDESGVDI